MSTSTQRVDNYCTELWPRIYDQYYGEEHEIEAPFYLRAAAEAGGPVLEVGCGTGLLFYKLLRSGCDVYGIDVSPQMLEALWERARPEEVSEVRRRAVRADMTGFDLGRKFRQIFVPARTFLHAATLEEQLATLRCLRRHLEEGGRLLANFFVPNPAHLAEALWTPCDEEFATYTDPSTGSEIAVRMLCRVADLNGQLMHVTWTFSTGEGEERSTMALRWVHRDEFRLMLELCGFARWSLCGGPKGEPFGPESTEMYWTAWT